MPELAFDEYQRVQDGMSYEQVVEIIGTQGEKEKVPFRDHLVKYKWVNNCGGIMIALFQDNQLVSKTEYGLSLRKQVFVLDGAKFSSLDEFYPYFAAAVSLNTDWGRNLDAFNDVLRGGFGTPEGGFILRWENSALSRERLGYPKTIKWFRRLLARCHSESVIDFRQSAAGAIQGRGRTLFDLIVEIIRDHGPGGDEEEDGVELRLL